jgi:DNA-binding CsgD family transcriptional regulator
MWHRSIRTDCVYPGSHASTQGVVSLMHAMASTEPDSLPRAILNLLRPAIDVHHCAIFSFRPGAAPQLEFEAGTSNEAPIPPDVGPNYVSRHYRADGASQFIDDLNRRDADGLFVFDQHLSDIGDAAYRQTCYERGGVVDRLSILAPVASTPRRRRSWLAINLYRRDGGRAFSTSEVRNSFELFAVSAAAVTVRNRLSEDERYKGLASSDVCTGLSGREREIAALVADGLSSKQIAARLCICTSTVTTLRKRAYEKLGVPNGKVLAAMWRQPQRAPVHAASPLMRTDGKGSRR